MVNKDRAYFLIDELRDDDDHILVGPGIRKIKLSNGQIVENMLKGYGPTDAGWVYPDNSGAGRIDVGTIGNERKSRLYARIGPKGDQSDDWTLINDGNVTGVQAGLLGFSADNRTAYLHDRGAQGPRRRLRARHGHRRAHAGAPPSARGRLSPCSSRRSPAPCSPWCTWTASRR